MLQAALATEARKSNLLPLGVPQTDTDGVSPRHLVLRSMEGLVKHSKLCLDIV